MHNIKLPMIGHSNCVQSQRDIVALGKENDNVHTCFNASLYFYLQMKVQKTCLHSYSLSMDIFTDSAKITDFHKMY